MLAREPHAHLARKRDALVPALGHQVAELDVVIPGDRVDDLLDGRLCRSAHRIRGAPVGKGLLGKLERDGDAVGHRQAAQARERTLELADVRVEARSDVCRHLVRHLQVMQRRLGLQDGDARLVRRPVDARHQTAVEAADEALLEVGDLRRCRVRAEDDLPPALVERVERMEELFLRLLVLGEEVDVVDHQHVRVAEAVAELHHPARTYRLMEDVHEGAARDVDDPRGRIAPEHLLADGLQEVGLAHPHAAVHEERVVGAAGLRGHGLRGGVRQPVVRAHDERLEDVVGRQHQLVIEERLAGGTGNGHIGR